MQAFFLCSRVLLSSHAGKNTPCTPSVEPACPSQPATEGQEPVTTSLEMGVSFS